MSQPGQTITKPEAQDPKPVKAIQSHPNHLSDGDKLICVSAVAESLERGERSITTIQKIVGDHMPTGTCARATAIKYRNAALALIHEETKPMNRDNIRNLEIGRYQYLIERIYKRIVEFEQNTPDKSNPDYLKWHDTWVKLMARLNDYGARLHAITGLNEITINDGRQAKRIVFVRPNDRPASAPIGDTPPSPDHAPAIPSTTVPTP